MNKNIGIFDLKFDSGFREKFHQGIDQVLDEAFLSNHTFVQKLEKSFAKFNQSPFSLAVSNGTSALEVALRAVNVRDKKVLLPSNTFMATASAVESSGGEVILCDIEDEYFGLCPNSLKNTIERVGKNNIAAIIAVHIGGHISPSIQEIVDICSEFNITLIEDAAHVIGASLNGVRSGNFSRFGCFSFFTTKVMTTGEGGMLVCQNKTDLELVKSIRQFGKNENISIMHERPGSNYKMNEFSALMGVLELERISKRIEKRRLLANIYKSLLNPNKYKVISDSDLSKGSYYKQIVIPLKESRETIEKELSNNSIPLTGNVYQIPLHRQDYLKDLFSNQSFPKTDAFSSSHFCPPCYPELEPEQIEYICSLMNEI